MRTIEEVVDILASDLSDAKWKNISLEYVSYGKLLSEILEIHKAEQRPKGKWIEVDPLGTGDKAYMCSACETGDWDVTIGEYKFCPYCGAEMEGGEDE